MYPPPPPLPHPLLSSLFSGEILPDESTATFHYHASPSDHDHTTAATTTSRGRRVGGGGDDDDNEDAEDNVKVMLQ